ncbi:MAG: hypothetical protein LBC33_00305, partial [Mycoplasmataceae bacterium]|nr:hypothetical protein [Mycoplasmataceae bacterium]
MMLDLGQIFAQTKGGWDSAMLTLVQWIVETILDFFEPIRDFFYFIFIYAPLQVIDVLVKIFKFFTNGFMSYLFFYQTNPDGSSVYSFKPNSSFYTVVIVILMISLIVFFINFLLKFREVRIVDEDGQPTVNQRSRLFQLKWPILMFLILIFTPFILTFVDSTISAIISAFNNDVPKALDSDTVERFDMESYELLGQYSRMLQYVVFTDLSGMTLSSYIDVSRTNIESLITQIDAARDQLQPADFALSLQFQRLELYLNRIKSTFNALTNSIKYIQTALADPFYADDEIGDTIAFNDMYVTDSLGRFLKNLGGQIQALQSACYQLNTVHTQIMDDTLSKNFAERYGSAYPTIAQDWNTELTYLQAFTDDLTYEVLASTKINFYVSPSSGSIAWRFLDPSSDINIYEFASHNKYGSGASIVKLIFSIVTGRPYYHWDDTVDPSIFADLSVYRIFFGSIMCWGFVMIMYTYVDFSIKRVFLMIYAWSIGWLYLAQGINKPEIPKKWYRALYGRWYSIIFLYLMFNAAEIVFSIIIPQIEIEVSSLDQIALQNFNIATSIGLMFACESIFTVFFQVVNSVDKQIYGVTDRNFSAQGSTFFGAGKKLFESSKSYYEQNLRNPLIKDWWNKPAEQVSKYQKQRDWRAANVGRISFGKEKDISGKKTGKWGITFHPGSKSIQSENVNAAYATRMAGAAKKRKELMAKPHLMQQDQHGNQVWKVPKSAKWTGTNLTGNGEVDNSWGNRFFNRMIRG